MDDNWLDTWSLSLRRTFAAMFDQTRRGPSEGTAPMSETESADDLSKFDQILVNPCCGPHSLKRATASSIQNSSVDLIKTLGSSEQSIGEQELASILTTTTIDESVSTSSIQSFMTPPIEQDKQREIHRDGKTRLGESVRQRRSPIPRPQRRRRRVCLLKDCNCQYHQALERSLGPIDVDSLCEEVKPEDKSVVTSILDDLEETFSIAQHKKSLVAHSTHSKSSRSLASGDTSTSSDSNIDPSFQVEVRVVSSRSSKPNPDNSDITNLAASSQVSVPVDVDDYMTCEQDGSGEDEFVLDELELSRELVGYIEGFEPEVITRYTTHDVARWEREQYMDAEDRLDLDSFHDLSSPEKSKSTSTFYPYSIPESAAEV